MPEEIEVRVLERILAGDRQGAVLLLDAWSRSHGYDRAVVEILEPALAKVGKKWATTEDLSLAQGYVAGKVAEDIMAKAAEAQAQEGTPPDRDLKGPVVIGNIEDDCHALGRRLVTTFLRLDGWEVHDLGNDVMPEQFVERAVETGAPIVAASAMMYTTAMNIKKLRENLDGSELSGQVQLAVGGAVFVQRPELVAMVGGDGTARNAIEAPAMMDALLDKARSMGHS